MKKYKKYIILLLILIVSFISICFVPIGANRFIPIIESQVEKDLGIKINIDKLIFRFGPSLKIKASTMSMMYSDGTEFGQFNNVRLFVPWSAFFSDDVSIKRIYADNLTSKISLDNQDLFTIIEKIKLKNFEENPDINLRNYNIQIDDIKNSKKYVFNGNDFQLIKVLNYKNMKIKAVGEFLINDKKYITYDIALLPYIDFDKDKIQLSNIDINKIVEQIINMDFHSDIIADLKLFKNNNNVNQISGLINIDNISVLNLERKNSKSYIYLTFLGNKIGINSNLYADNDKKIVAEGVINNSSKPEFDIKFKADSINLSEIFKKIKILVDCSKFKGIDNIEGNLVADFNVKGDLNKVKSTGFLRIENASIKAGGINVKNISSDVDFSNNIINISNAIGYVNNAPVMVKGKIAKNIDIEVLMNKVPLQHFSPAKYGVKDGVISLSAKINGTLDNVIHKENIQIENLKSEQGKNALSFDSLKIDTNKDNIAYISNVVIKPEQTSIIKLPLVKLIIERDFIRIPETNIFLPNSRLITKAEISNYNNNNITFNYNLDGSVSSRDINCLSKYSNSYPLKLNVSGNNTIQNIEGQIYLKDTGMFGEPSIVNILAKIENNNLKIDDLSILPFNGTFHKNLKSNLKGTKKIIVSGLIENMSDPLLKNLRIFVPQQVNINAFDNTLQLKGDIFINGKPNQPEIIGQVNIVSLINQLIQLSINNMSIDFNKNIAVLNAPIVKLSDSMLGINATISNNFSKEILFKNLNIKSKYLNSDTVLMYKNTPVFKLYPIIINEGKIYSERTMLNVYGSSLYLTALSADLILKDNVLHIKNLSSDIFNGKMAGNIDFNINEDAFDTKIQARGVSASPIFNVMTSKKDSISGIMDFDANLKGNISSEQSLNGDIKFIVHNGHMGTLGKLEHLLYAQNVIADNMLRTSLSVITKAISLKDTGLFKYLRSDITMKDGVANIKMLQSQGPLMSLFVKGHYNPSTDFASLTILGRISDDLVSGLGAFGEFSLNKLMIMLTGDEKNKYNINISEMEKIPELSSRNTKEFRSIINGIMEKPSSVIQFNWVSYTQKSLKQKEVPMENIKLPDFLQTIPY